MRSGHPDKRAHGHPEVSDQVLYPQEPYAARDPRIEFRGVSCFKVNIARVSNAPSQSSK